jgi:hypothetical protein
LNPLELVKTKIQLGNDEEVNQFALSQLRQVPHEDESLTIAPIVTGDNKKETIGTGHDEKPD